MSHGPVVRTFSFRSQGKYGQPIVPDLAVRHLCPNCRTDPPNIIEEYSHGDLVSSRGISLLINRSAATVEQFWVIASSIPAASVSGFALSGTDGAGRVCTVTQTVN